LTPADIMPWDRLVDGALSERAPGVWTFSVGMLFISLTYRHYYDILLAS
jgi:hypothetical protein